MTDARIGYGTGLAVFSGGAFFDIAEVFNITPGEAATDRQDATHMKSPNRRREYISGLIDSGEASFEINWIPGSETDVLLRNLQTSGENVDWRFTFNNGVTLTVQASVTGFGKAVPLDDKMTASLTLSISGDEDWGNEAAPTNLVLPSISGPSVQVGVALFANLGKFTGSPSEFTIQWQRDASGNGVFTNVTSGGTGVDYQPVVGDLTDHLRIGVTPRNSAGQGDTVYSLPVGPIIAA